jgi:hypothetical protein
MLVALAMGGRCKLLHPSPPPHPHTQEIETERSSVRPAWWSWTACFCVALAKPISHSTSVATNTIERASCVVRGPLRRTRPSPAPRPTRLRGRRLSGSCLGGSSLGLHCVAVLQLCACAKREPLPASASSSYTQKKLKEAPSLVRRGSGVFIHIPSKPRTSGLL